MRVSHRLMFLLVLLVAHSRAQAFQGNEGAHGGDTYALEFVTLGQALVKDLPSYQASHPEIAAKWGLRTGELSEVVQRTRVVSGEGSQVILDGSEVDAINFPEQSKILVNRSRWRESDLRSRVALVLHEYFGILGIERDRFDASNDFASFVNEVASEVRKGAASGAVLANLYYGRCTVIPALDDLNTCDPDSAKFAQARSCAIRQATQKCQADGHWSCRVISTESSAVIGSAPSWMRYCEVLSIAK